MIEQDMKCPEGLPTVVFVAFKAHVFERRQVGGFVTACLENDFGAAACKADGGNYPALRQIAQFIHNDLPTDCHGSREKVTAWLNKE